MRFEYAILSMYTNGRNSLINYKGWQAIAMSGTHQSVLLTVGLDERDNALMKNALSSEFIILRAVDANEAMRILTEENPCGMLLLNLIPLRL